MKNQHETQALKVTEKFDKELLNALSSDLKLLKSVKNKILTKLTANTNNNMLVA